MFDDGRIIIGVFGGFQPSFEDPKLSFLLLFHSLVRGMRSCLEMTLYHVSIVQWHWLVDDLNSSSSKFHGKQWKRIEGFDDFFGIF